MHLPLASLILSLWCAPPLVSSLCFDEVLLGPDTPGVQAAWLANLTAWRTATLASVGYNGSVYSEYLPWTTSMYIAPQSHLYDRFLFDPATGTWTPDRFLDDLVKRYGGVDGVLLWASYPNLGVDERSQFDVLEDLPGGLPALASVVSVFHSRGVKVGMAYNPWDIGTTRRNASDPTLLAALGVTLQSDFVNGDTMDYMDPAFWLESVAAGRPLALQPEGNANASSLAWTLMGWGYWPGSVYCPPAPSIPMVDKYKWLERRHLTQVCNRWGAYDTHRLDITAAFFNGAGFVTWESVWGTWNGLSPRDGEAVRRMGALSRFLAPFLVSPTWEPHAALAPAPAAAGIYASRWPLAPNATPGAAFFPRGAVAYTLISRSRGGASAGPTVPVPCSAPQPGPSGPSLLTGSSARSYYDLYTGLQVQPVPLAGGGGGGCAVPVTVEAGWFGALLDCDSLDPPPTAFLATMANMTTGLPLSSLNGAPTYLLQNMTAWPSPTGPPPPSPPPGMVRIPGAPNFTFVVDGTEMEGSGFPGCDVQFPWEAIANSAHRHNISVPDLYVDVTPVTNAQYAGFLNSSGYAPLDTHNFLRDWASPAAGPPSNWSAKPVTWVDLLDAAAYCAHYGKRLPNDWEWQYASQGGVVGQAYPWGPSFSPANVPPQQTGTVRPPPPDVGGFPSGDTPSGLKDMMGLVWQWTNEFTDIHTRAGLVRGGSYYTAMSPTCTSGCWYFPNNLAPGPSPRVTAMTHGKLLLMAPSYDRHGAVGFRCVREA